MNSLTIEKRRDRYELISKIGIAAVAVVLVAPFIFILVKGLIGIAAAVAIASVMIAITPAASLAIANFGVSLLKLEAGRNPVETLQNEYKEKSIQLEEKRGNIEKCAAQVLTFKGKVEGLKIKYPDEATKFEEQVAGMEALLAVRKEKYKAAGRELQAFRDIVDKADAIWQVTQALSAASSGVDKTEEFFSEMRTKTALDSVQLSLNHSFAALDTSLLEASIEKHPQLTA